MFCSSRQILMVRKGGTMVLLTVKVADSWTRGSLAIQLTHAACPTVNSLIDCYLISALFPCSTVEQWVQSENKKNSRSLPTYKETVFEKINLNGTKCDSWFCEFCQSDYSSFFMVTRGLMRAVLF